jgi:ABC-type spermidine/putrescine transport system permease subunit II
MPEFISNNLTSIVVALIAAVFAASVAIFVGVKIKKRRTDTRNIVNQSGNFVGGDQAGRDINKSNSR